MRRVLCPLAADRYRGRRAGNDKNVPPSSEPKLRELILIKLDFFMTCYKPKQLNKSYTVINLGGIGIWLLKTLAWRPA